MEPKEKREKTAEIWFEKLDIKGFAFGYQPSLCLYSTGRTSGVVVDVGHQISQVAVVEEGSLLPPFTKKMYLAGRDMTEQMAGYIKKISLKGDNDLPTQIKESTCYVAYDYDQEMAKYKSSKEHEKDFLMPDGVIIKVGIESFKVPELLFQPQLVGHEEPGIHSLPYYAITALSEIHSIMQADLYKNIVLVGGSSVLPGLKDRLNKDLIPLVDPKYNIKILSHHQPHSAAWLGGSIMSQLATFDQKWITRDQYDEEGAACIVSRENN